MGGTLVPIIIATDKTQLSNFSGDKAAYPVYLSLGNIPKHIRRQPSQRGTVLLGYLPVPALACCSEEKRAMRTYQVFHACMRKLLEPLVATGRDGKKMVCADGKERLVFPILGAYVADHPEQCLVTCCLENRCPRCTVAHNRRGEPLHSPLRDPTLTLHHIHGVTRTSPPSSDAQTAIKLEGIRLIDRPFWADLPHADIFSCITPDFLHQLHKGVFKPHLVSWCQALMSDGEMDCRFMSMSRHPTLRHFKKGITTVKQWTGKEMKMMEKVFVGVVAGAVDDSSVVDAARSLIDFITMAQYLQHTDDTLEELSAALADFHKSKSIFISNNVRQHFNIP